MNPANPFLANNYASSAFTVYHSAYRGTSYQPDGNFSHFTRAIDASHIQSGYWRYRSADDDRLAMTWGLEKPEDLLIAVETSTDCEEFDKLTLLWIKGAGDPNLRGNVSGTAAQHLRTIYEIRQLLGLPMSSRGKTPTYPVITDMRLKLYWDRMYERQPAVSILRPFDVVSQATLPLAPPPILLQPSQSTHLQYMSNVRPHHQHMNPYGSREVASIPPMSTMQPPFSFNNPVAMAAYSQLPLPAYSSFNHGGMSGAINTVGVGQCSSSATPSSLLSGSAAANKNKPVPIPRATATRRPAANRPQPPPNNTNPNHDSCPTTNHTQPSQPTDLEHLDKLGCMWCEKKDFHENDCPFGILGCTNNPTVFDYRILTDAVEQFDPGPWTVHFDQFPETELEDPLTQIAGMAEVIQGEDSYKSDAKLHGLRDDHLVMLWALKASNGVEIMDEQDGLS